MPDWIRLNPQDHARAGWRKFTRYSFAGQDPFSPVLMAELTQVLAYYPLAFMPGQPAAGQPSRYHLVALQSLEPGVNLYLAPEGRWLAPYIPSHYRGYPFSLTETGELAIDRASGLFVDPAPPDATAFYTPDGALADTAARVLDFLQQRRQNLLLTQNLVDQLARFELIEPWPIRWQPHDQPQTVTGYHRTREARLRALPPEAYAELAHSGALGLAYAQLFSQARLSDLQYRHARQPRPTPLDTLNLDRLFGTADDDIVKF